MTARSHDRLLGIAIGASAAPAAMWGAGWSALGANSGVAWTLTVLTGAVLGGLTWPVFLGDRDVTLSFSTLFGGCAGLLAGALVGGPVGGVFGLCGGGVAGLGLPVVDRALPTLNSRARGATMIAVGSALGALVGWGMTL